MTCSLHPFLILPTCHLCSGSAQPVTRSQRLYITVHHALTSSLPYTSSACFHPCFLFLTPRCISSFWICALVKHHCQLWPGLPPIPHPPLLAALRTLGIYLTASFLEWQSWSGLVLEQAHGHIAEVWLPALPTLPRPT